jgi:hypothetical protein
LTPERTPFYGEISKLLRTFSVYPPEQRAFGAFVVEKMNYNTPGAQLMLDVGCAPISNFKLLCRGLRGGWDRTRGKPVLNALSFSEKILVHHQDFLQLTVTPLAGKLRTG